MTTDRDPITFARLSDGTLLQRQSDGSFRAITSDTDRTGLAAFSDDQIEAMASSDADHPGLDDAFWRGASQLDAGAEVISITLDRDVLSFFRREGPSFRAHINDVLRQYVEDRS